MTNRLQVGDYKDKYRFTNAQWKAVRKACSDALEEHFRDVDTCTLSFKDEEILQKRDSAVNKALEECVSATMHLAPQEVEDLRFDLRKYAREWKKTREKTRKRKTVQAAAAAAATAAESASSTSRIVAPTIHARSETPSFVDDQSEFSHLESLLASTPKSIRGISLPHSPMVTKTDTTSEPQSLPPSPTSFLHHEQLSPTVETSLQTSSRSLQPSIRPADTQSKDIQPKEMQPEEIQPRKKPLEQQMLSKVWTATSQKFETKRRKLQGQALFGGLAIKTETDQYHGRKETTDTSSADTGLGDLFAKTSVAGTSNTGLSIPGRLGVNDDESYTSPESDVRQVNEEEWVAQRNEWHPCSGSDFMSKRRKQLSRSMGSKAMH